MSKPLAYKIGLLFALLSFCVTAHPQSRGLFPVAVNGLWGFADRSGKMVILPQFEQAFEFHEGLANVKVDGQYGYVDEHGTLVIAPQYDMPSDFSEGLAGVGEEERRGSVIANWYGYIDHTGKMVIPAVYSFAGDFHEGLAAVEVTVENKERGYGFISQWGYIDKGGKMVIPTQFYEADRFSQGRAAVSLEGGHAYIDTKGLLIWGPEDTGAVVLDCKEFSSGLAPILRGDKVGYIGLDGKVAIHPRFADADCFSEGLARIRIGDRYGFIDTKGKTVIPAVYISAEKFSGGLAAVQLAETGIFYINNHGEIVIRGPFRKGKPFTGGVAFVEDDVYGMGGYIANNGVIFNQFRIPENGCPNCAAYFRPLLDMEIDSKPEGATIYLVPVYTFEHQAGIESDDVALANFRLPYGVTNISCKGCVYEQKYWAIFVENGRRCRMLIDALHANANKFSTSLDKAVSGICP